MTRARFSPQAAAPPIARINCVEKPRTRNKDGFRKRKDLRRSLPAFQMRTFPNCLLWFGRLRRTKFLRSDPKAKTQRFAPVFLQMASAALEIGLRASRS